MTTHPYDATRRAVLASVGALTLTGLLRPVPATAASAAAGTVRLDNMPVALRAGTTQVVTCNRTSGYKARVAFWRLVDGRWRSEFSTTDGRIGYGGLVSPGSRRQGSGTTPMGTYGIPFTFGRWNHSSAWRMPYLKMVTGDYWVLDNDSRFYNRFRKRSSGGFRTAGSEHLVDFGDQYEMSAVLDFNYAAPVRHRGGAIFLHVNGRGATAGCVSVPRVMMGAVMRELQPGAVPVVTIGAG